MIRSSLTPRIAWASLAVFAVAAGIGAHLWLGREAESQPTRPLAPGGALFAVHAEPRPMPELAFEDDMGRKRAHSEFRGKVVLLNIWATWCVPCREEMPALDRLQQKLGGPEFEVLALSIDAGGAPAVRRFYDEIGIRALAIYVDPGIRATSSLQVIGLPTTLLVDRKGREIGRHLGPAQWDAAEAVRTIVRYVESP